jgi:hypothetical protein
LLRRDGLNRLDSIPRKIRVARIGLVAGKQKRQQHGRRDSG